MAKLIKRLSLMILLCALMAGTMVVRTDAAGVGVSVGNSNDYDIVARYSASSSDIPASLYEINQTQLITVTIDSVTGSLINSTIKTTYRNGTDLTAQGFCDVDTGECVGIPFLEANLAAGDLVNPSAPEPWYINETVTRTYQGVARETNHMVFDTSYTIADVGDVSGKIDYYFDKATGVLMEYTTTVTQAEYTSIVQSTLVNSNVGLGNGNTTTDGSSSSPPIALYIGVVAVAVIAVAAVLVVRKRRSASQQNEDDEEDSK
jgi:hypothetical protein